MRKSNYDKYPATRVEGELWKGWQAIREKLAAVCDAEGDFERLRVGDVVACGQRVGYNINIEQQVVARSGFEPQAAVARHVRGFCRQVRADVRDVRFGRGESDAFVAGIEAAAHQRCVVTPPAVVTA